MYSFGEVTSASNAVEKLEFISNKKLIKILKRNKKNKISSLEANCEIVTIKVYL